MRRPAIEVRADEQMRAAIKAGDLLAFISMFEDMVELSGHGATEQHTRWYVSGTLQGMAIEAAGTGQIAIMKWLRDTVPNFGENIWTLNVLRTIATADQISMMRWVLEQGIYVRDVVIEAGIKKGWSNEMFELLLRHGSDVNWKRSAGKFKFFIWRRQAPSDAPPSDLLDRDEAFLQMLLDYGLDINTRDGWSSWTALDHVAARGSIASFKLLLHRGANLSRGNPLHAAASSRDRTGREEMMAYLLDEVGLGVNTISTFKTRSARLGFENGTPMHVAINAENHVNVKFLLGRGADLKVRNEKGVDAWMLAESYGAEIVDVLERTRQKRPVTTRKS